MKYVKCSIKCKCGKVISFNPPAELIPVTDDCNMRLSCPSCTNVSIVEPNTKVHILCYKDTHKPVLFDEEEKGEAFYGNPN